MMSTIRQEKNPENALLHIIIDIHDKVHNLVISFIVFELYHSRQVAVFFLDVNNMTLSRQV